MKSYYNWFLLKFFKVDTFNQIVYTGTDSLTMYVVSLEVNFLVYNQLILIRNVCIYVS